MFISKQLYKTTKKEILNSYVKDHLINIKTIDSVINLDKYIVKLI